MYTCVPCACLVMEKVREGHEMSWNKRDGRLKAVMRVLGMVPGSSASVANAPNQ